MPKTYNTPKRNHIIKTRLDDDEHTEFLRRMELYGMSQSEFIRQAVSVIGKLTAEYGRIGNNLNQIARSLNEWHSPYPEMAKELRDSAADLAALKYEVLQKVGDALGNIQTYQL